MYQLLFDVWVDEHYAPTKRWEPKLQDVRNSREALIVGLGPAGIFAALKLIELNIKPIVLERGKPVRERRRDIADVTKNGIVNPDSNYCFGEGGAGTFSDGKLYTRSSKRGSVERILNIFGHFGASPEILIDAHPHIGTNKLPQVIQAMREAIVECGGEVHFETRIAGIETNLGSFQALRTRDGNRFSAAAVILATGHSARDVFELLERADLRLEPKAFALGVRVEHPQSFVDSVQYHSPVRPETLPAASYALQHQVKGRGVFSFCMCPGGVICPAASEEGEIVVNGWSPSKRNSRYANSGIVVEVALGDLAELKQTMPNEPPHRLGLRLQQKLERSAATAGGGKQVAPAERLIDFVEDKSPGNLPSCSYIPGLRPTRLSEVLTPQFTERLRAAFLHFDTEMKGYLHPESVVVGVESRTSSPIRIPRDEASLMHPDAVGLFPCGEGAGYAGGIVSAAMDGERCALALAKYFASSDW